MDAIPWPIAAVSADGHIHAANAAWTRMADPDRADAGWLQRLFPAAGEAVRQAIATASQTTLAAQALILGPADVTTWWDLDCVPHPDAGHIALVTARDSTEHVLARREAEDIRTVLLPTDQRLTLAQDATGIGTWEWDARANRRSWSPRQFQLHGLDPQTDAPPSMEAWLAMVHPLDRPLIQAKLDGKSDFDPDHGYQMEFRIRRADTGAERWLLSLGKVIETAPDGGIARILGVNVDITERRAEQQSVREREELLRIASDAAGIYAWDWDLDTGKVTWAEGLETALGMPKGGFGGTVAAFRALLHPDDAPGVEAAIARALAGETKEYRASFRMLRADGGIRWTETRGTVVRDHLARPVRVVGMDYDITDQKLAETALVEREARFRALADAMPQLIYVASADGVSEYKNQRWFAFSGQTPEQAHRDGWIDMVHPDDRQAAVAAWTSAIATGAPYKAEYRLLRHDGIHRHFLSRAVPLRDDAGRIIRWLGTSTDISDIVEARQAAARMAAELEARIAERTKALTCAALELQAEMRRRQEIQATLLQSQKLEALGQLTAGVAHDFNNVLAAIHGSFELLAKRTADPRLLKFIELGKGAADRASSLTRKLLDFGRLENPEAAVLDVEQALRRADELIGHAVGGAIPRTMDIQDGVWPVLTDGHQLEIALLNLAINARDAMPDGGQLTLSAQNLPPSRRPETLPFKDYVSIRVIDTGQGMPPDVVARALEPFFTTKVEGKGTGLGLPMVHAFAQRSGGALRIESREGAGTTIEIILPRASVTGMERGVPDLSSVAMTERNRRVRILVVDDDDRVRQVTVGFLRDQGYDVIEAANAEAAIVLSHTIEDLDLLLTDVVMPGSNGPELVQRLRTERPGLQVLYVSWYPGSDAMHGEHVLLKPFIGADLTRAIDRRVKQMSDGSTAHGGLLRRLKAPSLVASYLFWKAAWNDKLPPRMTDLDWGGLPDAVNAFTVEVDHTDQGVVFRFLQVGRGLVSRLGRELAGTTVSIADADDPDDKVLGSLARAYRRCSRSFSPTYDYARYDFGDGAPVLFERVIFPVSDDGQRVTHLVGVALFSGET